MTITIDADLVALLIIGFIAGTAAAAVLGRGRRSMLWNGLIGVLGAFLGTVLFDALNLNDDIPEFLQGSISVADIVVAIVGAAIIMLVANRFLD